MDSNDIWTGIFAILLMLNVTTLLTGEFYWLILFFTIILFTSLVKVMWRTSGWFASELNSIFGDKIEIEFEINDLIDLEKLKSDN